MSIQLPKRFPASFATNASVTSGTDLGGGYLYVSIEIPAAISTMFGAASTPIYIQGSNDNVTYRRFTEILTSTVANDFSIASSASNRFAAVPYFNFRFARLEASATVTGAVVPPTFSIICTDSL